MAICGFNQKIGDGLSLLFEGMADSLAKKASTNTNEKILDREIIELKNIIQVLNTAQNDTLAKMFAGLNSLALPMFALVLEELKENPSKDLKEVCAKIGNRFIDLLSKTEKKNEAIALLEWKDEVIASRARLLANWVLDQNKQVEKVS